MSKFKKVMQALFVVAQCITMGVVLSIAVGVDALYWPTWEAKHEAEKAAGTAQHLLKAGDDRRDEVADLTEKVRQLTMSLETIGDQVGNIRQEQIMSKKATPPVKVYVVTDGTQTEMRAAGR